MALVRNQSSGLDRPEISSQNDTKEAELLRKKARTLAKQQQAAERIVAAVVQLNSGIKEAASASSQLKVASQQIASGAEEASSASQESLRAVNSVNSSITQQLSVANNIKNKVDDMTVLTDRVAISVDETVSNVEVAAKRQEESVKMVTELERQAANIGDIVKAVARIADQTNLLALNAAIEAARAGKHGKGFAVVADEVRTLAETSEKSAREIQDLIKHIQESVQVISQGIIQSAEWVKKDVQKGKEVVEKMTEVKNSLSNISVGAIEVAAMANSQKPQLLKLYAEQNKLPQQQKSSLRLVKKQIRLLIHNLQLFIKQKNQVKC